MIANAYATDDDINELMTAVKENFLRVPTRLINKGYKFHMGQLKIHNNRLFLNNKLIIPSDEPLRLRLLQLYHLPARLGHPGYKSMYEIISRSYYWPRLKSDCLKFTLACQTCRKANPSTIKKQGFLQPLEPPDRRWQCVTFDFIEKLPASRWKNENHKYILVMVDRLSKGIILEGLPDNSVNSLYEAVHRRLFCTKGLVKEFINDRGSAMISKLWKRICQRYGIHIKYSSAQHPETDGQTEVTNKSVKCFLRKFINYAQNNWMYWLPRAEFALNNRVNRSIGMSPFFANNGYHPRLGIEPQAPNELRDPRIDRADHIVARTRAMDQKLGTLIKAAQEEFAQQANKHRTCHPNYKIGDLVYVNACDMISTRPY